MPQQEKKQGQLIQAFGLQAAIILVVSSIIGSGVYKKVAPMSDKLESADLVLLAWLLAGIISMLGVLTTAEIAGMVSGSGGPFAYFNRIYGRTFAFFYGWSSFTAIQSASIAAIAYVFAHSFNAVVPLPRLDAAAEAFNILGIFYPLQNLGVKLAAVGLIVLLVGINYRGVRQGGSVSNIITNTVIASIILIIILGLTMGVGSMVNFQTPASTYPPDSFSSGNFGFVTALFAAMLSAFWAYEGWITLGFMAGEIKDPTRNIPRSLIFGTLIVIAIYLLINFVYLYVLPMDEMIAVAKDTNKIAAIEVIRRLFGDTGVLLLSVLIVVTTAGCTNTTIMASARIYYAMAAQGIFFNKAAHIHPRYHTPGNALIYQAIVSCLLVFSGSFDQLTDMLVFVQFIFYGAVAVGVFILRKREPDTPRPYKAVGYPVVPILYILFCAYLVVNTIITNPRNAIFGLVLVLLGTPFYLYWIRENKKPLDPSVLDDLEER